MERTQFTFYESFFRAISRIRSAESKAEAYDAICRYALYGEEPDMDTVAETAAMVFELVKPNLDASRRKAENGKTGGERSKPEAKPSKPEAKPSKTKQTESKKEKEKENKKENEIENKCYPPTPLKKPAKEPKVQFAENVTMTNEEHQKLLDTHGPADTQRLIEILDNYKGSSGKKYTSDYRAILSWCIDRLKEEKNKGGASKGPCVSQPSSAELQQSRDLMAKYRREMEARREQQS